MPPEVTLDLGHNKTLLSWSFADATHYRAVLHVLQPSIDSGTVTIVANGKTVTTFDERSDTATVVRLGVPAHQKVPATAPSLLDLEGGTPLTTPPFDPNPAQPLQAVEAAMIRSRQDAHVWIAGQQSILGHQADVMQIQPLESTAWSTCSPPSRSGCAHPILHQHPWGWAKVWVDRQHPFTLRSQDGGLPIGMRIGGVQHGFRVLSVTYGVRPTAADLQYRPPVTPQRLDYWCDSGCTYGGRLVPVAIIRIPGVL
jgi:hypothetical protein